MFAHTMTDKKCLYISYTGLTEPLGKSQILGYLEQIDTDLDIHILSFEKSPERTDLQKVESRIQDQNIEWHHIERCRGPTLLSTFMDIFVGFLLSLYIYAKNGFDLVHARSYIPMMISLPLAVFSTTNIIFDIRGFWIDERVDRNSIDPDGRLYTYLKRIEHLLFQQADVVIALTKASRDIITQKYSVKPDNIYIIPTCVDTEKFEMSDNSPDGPFLLGYVGTVNEWHHFDEVLDCYHLLSEQVDESCFKIYNKGDRNKIQREIEKYPKNMDNIEIKSVSHSEMPKKYSELDAGIFFYKDTYSKKATCPTKMGEFLSTGTPCIGNSGVGDVEDILEQNQVGVAISEFSEKEKREAITELLEIIDDPYSNQRCRNVAINQLSLESGSNILQDIYTQHHTKSVS
ncbi:glycosyltransferase [Halostagnicola kamekurae]|uniref:Glycosyltransferase involved in cell wall bisynthesis n=1 Tax=Halostagnicola kamekurae TaxID=619731 RepID=A0A1I6QMZ3_9EURY|nr:glycosyltransferase [Halostagnicola kamekurae]SFS53811.1 Glycosyltransferase involved in cell wall bisynthesis [Halostagnicola kamekurae]